MGGTIHCKKHEASGRHDGDRNLIKCRNLNRLIELRKSVKCAYCVRKRSVECSSKQVNRKHAECRTIGYEKTLLQKISE